MSRNVQAKGKGKQVAVDQSARGTRMHNIRAKNRALLVMLLCAVALFYTLSILKYLS